MKQIFDAIFEDDLNKLKTLITPQNINIKNNSGFTPLHYAVFHCKVDIVKFLVSQCANTNEQRNDNTSILNTAKIFKNDEIIKCLVDAGATVDTEQILKNKKYDEKYHDKKLKYMKILRLNDM